MKRTIAAAALMLLYCGAVEAVPIPGESSYLNRAVIGMFGGLLIAAFAGLFWLARELIRKRKAPPAAPIPDVQKAEPHRAHHNGGREAPVVSRPVGNRNTQAVSPPVPTSQPGAVPLGGGGSAGWVLGGAIAIGVLILIGNSGHEDSQPTANPMSTRPPVASSTPARTSTPALTPPSIEQKQAKKKVDSNKDMRHCLNLPTNEAIAKCTNRGH